MNRLFTHSMFGYSHFNLWRGEKHQKGIYVWGIYINISKKKNYVHEKESFILSVSDLYITDMVINVHNSDGLCTISRKNDSKKKLISKLVYLL